MDESKKRQLLSTIKLTALSLEHLGEDLSINPCDDEELNEELQRSIGVLVANLCRYRGEIAGSLGIFESTAFTELMSKCDELDPTG